jgi:hypothetical protein
MIGEGQGNFSPSVQVPSDSNPMEMLGLALQEGGGIGVELTAAKKLYDLVGRVGRFTAFSKS